MLLIHCLILFLIVACSTGTSFAQAQPLGSTLPRIIPPFPTIDLTKGPWWGRQGFEASWIQQEFAPDYEFEARFPLVLNEIFRTEYGLRMSEFTLQTQFWLETNALQESLVLFIEQIGEGWEIYINGHLLESQLFLSPDGKELVRYRVTKNIRLDLPHGFLRQGKNILTFRMAGHHPLTRFNLNSMSGLGQRQYFISTTRQIPAQHNSIQVALFTILVTVGSFFLISYSLFNRIRYFIFAGMFLVNVGIFYAVKSGLLDDFFSDTRYRLQLEYFALTGLFPLLQLSIDSFLFSKDRIPIVSKFFTFLSPSFITVYALTPVPFNQVMVRVWQVLMIFFAIWLVVRVLTAVRLKKRDAKKCAWLMTAGAMTTIMEVLSSILNIPFGETGQFVAIGLAFLMIFILSTEQVRAQVELQNLAEALTREKESIARFVPTQYLTYLGKSSTVEVQLGDQVQRTMSILFADIRSFTSLSEQMSPQENFNFINAYLGRVGPIIRQYGGIIDKYIGDGIMALFPGASDDAVQAAIAIQKEVEVYNAQRKTSNEVPLAVGIGIHRGELMLGTIGESMRMEGTVISDAVNVASRLEGLSKVLAVQIVVSEALLASLDQCPTGIRRLGCIRVKGKAMHIEAVEIFEGAAPKEYRAKLQTLEIFHEAMTAFHAEDWEKASHLFAQVMKLNPLDQTCQFYMDCVERRNKDLFRVLDHDRAG